MTTISDNVVALNSEVLRKPNVYPLAPPLIEFKGYGKIPRMGNMVITEKIDGTNAAVGIMAITDTMWDHPDLSSGLTTRVKDPETGDWWMVYAQSRKRLISVADDNFGFARWARDNAHTLVPDLGPGLHFGEWWGAGVQRTYGQAQKFFSVFNTGRWYGEVFTTPNLRCVPLLTVHTFDSNVIEGELADLMKHGSVAAPGFTDPEGIVIFLPASNQLYKKTEKDVPKSVEAAALQAAA